MQAIATSGVPPRDHLWLANVCAHHRSLGDAVMLSEDEKQEEENIHVSTEGMVQAGMGVC